MEQPKTLKELVLHMLTSTGSCTIIKKSLYSDMHYASYIIDSRHNQQLESFNRYKFNNGDIYLTNEKQWREMLEDINPTEFILSEKYAISYGDINKSNTRVLVGVWEQNITIYERKKD